MRSQQSSLSSTENAGTHPYIDAKTNKNDFRLTLMNVKSSQEDNAGGGGREAEQCVWVGERKKHKMGHLR